MGNLIFYYTHICYSKCHFLNQEHYIQKLNFLLIIPVFLIFQSSIPKFMYTLSGNLLDVQWTGPYALKKLTFHEVNQTKF